MRSRTAEAGFATASVLVVVSGLALVAAGLVSLGVNIHERVNREIEREKLKSALEEAAFMLLPDMVSGDVYPQTIHQLRVRGEAVEVEVLNEQRKVDLNSALAEEIERALGKLGSATAARVADQAVRARDGNRRAILDIYDFGERLGLSREQTVCLQILATTVKATADPLETKKSRRTQMAGAIYHVRARESDKGEPDLGFEMAVLVTGRNHDSVWILWQRYERISLWERCSETA